MGEQADYMLSGEDCAGCGEFLGVDAGIPCYCSKECFVDAGYPPEDWAVHEQMIIDFTARTDDR